MDPRTYLDTFGIEGAEALVAAVNAAKETTGHETTVGYFKQIAYGHRRPSIELAESMVAHDPKRSLDLISLLKAKKPKPPPQDGHAAA